jgi:hypothetical protein
MPVRLKILRYVWETAWSGARSVPPWPDPVFTEIFQAANGWSVRDFWLRYGRVDLEFDIASWGILYGQSHERLREDRMGILACCRRQAMADGIDLTGFDHVVAFVHEPPADTGTCGGDAVLDQGAGPLERYHRHIGRLLGLRHPPGGADDRCVMGAGVAGPPGEAVLPGVELWRGERRLCAACLGVVRRLRRRP